MSDRKDGGNVVKFTPPDLQPYPLQFQKVPEPEQLTQIEKQVVNADQMLEDQPFPRGMAVAENLHRFRCEYPFVDVAPLANNCKSFALGAAGIPVVIDIPSGALWLEISVSNSVMVSANGNAALPVVGTPVEGSFVVNPDWAKKRIYCAGIRQLSMCPIVAATFASIGFYTQG